MDEGGRRLVATELNPETILARSGLLDALQALGAHRESVVLVGAQAIYLRTGTAAVALAEFTTDADLAIDPRRLESAPLLEAVLTEGGLMRDPRNSNPGAWLSGRGVPIDVMVPAALAGSGRRSVALPPHDSSAMRKTVGLEAALVDNSIMTVGGYEAGDSRVFDVRVAGAAALLVAKLHKVGERLGDPRRSDAKDAHDIFRILVATPTGELKDGIDGALRHDVSAGVTSRALVMLQELFVEGADAPGSAMAGRAEAGIGDPAQTSLAASVLAADLLRSLNE